MNATAERAKQDDHGKANARATLDEIRELIDAIEELEENSDLETVTLEGYEYTREQIEERIQEHPLSLQLRSGWTSPGAKFESEEFELLMGTGGPACRIIGDLDENKEPENIRVEYQDWGTPWIELCSISQDDGAALQRFCNYFYFGS